MSPRLLSIPFEKGLPYIYILWPRLLLCADVVQNTASHVTAGVGSSSVHCVARGVTGTGGTDLQPGRGVPAGVSFIGELRR